MSKHTPGPWTVGKPFKHNGNTVTPIEYRAEPCGSCGISSGNWLVAWLFKNALPKGMIKSNAHLIAAAPDLYAACKESLQFIEDSEGGDPRVLTNMLRAAIAKAEGGDQ